MEDNRGWGKRGCEPGVSMAGEIGPSYMHDLFLEKKKANALVSFFLSPLLHWRHVLLWSGSFWSGLSGPRIH